MHESPIIANSEVGKPSVWRSGRLKMRRRVRAKHPLAHRYVWEHVHGGSMPPGPPAHQEPRTRNVPSIPSPELSPNWWKDVKPEGVRGRELEKALKEFEKAEKACAKDPSSSKKVAKAVKSLTRAVSKATRECDSDEDEDVIDALADLVELAEERLEELESQGDDPLLDVRRLRDQMRLLRKMPMTFALGLGTGDEIYFTLDRYVTGVPLMTKLKKASGCGLATYGIASAEGSELCLEVKGPSLSGLKRRVREFLKDNQPLPMQKVRLGKPKEEERPAPSKGDEVAFARKIAKAVNGKRKKIEQEVDDALARLREFEREAEGEAVERASELRETLEGLRAEGRKRVKRVKGTAEVLLQQKSPAARKALEKAAKSAAQGYQEARREIDESLDWLDSEVS